MNPWAEWMRLARALVATTTEEKPMCRQRNCYEPVEAADREGGDHQYCTRHRVLREQCELSLEMADDYEDLKNWLEEYVLPRAMDDLE